MNSSIHRQIEKKKTKKRMIYCLKQFQVVVFFSFFLSSHSLAINLSLNGHLYQCICQAVLSWWSTWNESNMMNIETHQVSIEKRIIYLIFLERNKKNRNREGKKWNYLFFQVQHESKKNFSSHICNYGNSFVALHVEGKVVELFFSVFFLCFFFTFHRREKERDRKKKKVKLLFIREIHLVFMPYVWRLDELLIHMGVCETVERNFDVMNDGVINHIFFVASISLCLVVGCFFFLLLFEKMYDVNICQCY